MTELEFYNKVRAVANNILAKAEEIKLMPFTRDDLEALGYGTNPNRKEYMYLSRDDYYKYMLDNLSNPYLSDSAKDRIEEIGLPLLVTAEDMRAFESKYTLK